MMSKEIAVFPQFRVEENSIPIQSKGEAISECTYVTARSLLTRKCPKGVDGFVQVQFFWEVGRIRFAC